MSVQTTPLFLCAPRGMRFHTYSSRPFIEQISIPLMDSDFIQLWPPLTGFFFRFIFYYYFHVGFSDGVRIVRGSRTTDGAWKHLFPIFMNYGLYKSHSPTPEPLCNDYSEPPLCPRGCPPYGCLFSGADRDGTRSEKKNAAPVPCRTCTQLQWNGIKD